MKNSTKATAAGKVAAGTPVGSERQGGVTVAASTTWRYAAPRGMADGYCPVLDHGSLAARAAAFAIDGGGADLIAEIEGRCARTRRPLAA